MALRKRIVSSVVRSFPRDFWTDFHARLVGAYSDLYEEVKNDTNTLELQRPLKLQQDRPFRMDFELTRVAAKHGIVCSVNEIPNNRWRHAFAVSGSLGVTQSYVPEYGEFPQPAVFRESLSNASRFPMLALENDGEFNKEYEFYGLVAHTPLGRGFDETSCKLGAAQLCVSHPGMGAWAANIGLLELAAEYPVEETYQVATSAQPKWKTNKKRDNERRRDGS